MSTCKLSGCCKKIYIKNNNLCKTISIILILFFLLGINTNVSYLERGTFKIKELMCIKKIADTLCELCIIHIQGACRAPPEPRGARGGPLPPLPGRVNQSCLR